VCSRSIFIQPIIPITNIKQLNTIGAKITAIIVIAINENTSSIIVRMILNITPKMDKII
jgi:hypothetical protein